jgi:hypothetical protein
MRSKALAPPGPPLMTPGLGSPPSSNASSSRRTFRNALTRTVPSEGSSRAARASQIPRDRLSHRRAEVTDEDAGFGEVRTEEVTVRFAVADTDEYLSVTADVSPLGLALQSVSDAERAVVEADVEDALGRFAAEAGYEFSGVALCTVAT